MSDDTVTRPAYYGGEDNPAEPLKIIEAWGFGPGFCRGNVIKYVARAGSKPGAEELDDLKKAAFYLAREIQRLEGEARR